MAKSSGKRSSRKVLKPPKPYPSFPLTPHASGKWQKKIKGKIFYFGRWGAVVNGSMQRLPGDGWQEAYEQQAADLHAGRTPRVKNPGGLTLRDLCNRFLTAKTRKKSSGELSARTLMELRQTTDRLIEAFGRDRLVDDITAEDFGELRASIAETWGRCDSPTRLPA